MNDPSSRQLAEQIARLALSKKAQDVLVMDMRHISGFADFFVICHGESDVQVKAISRAITGGLKQEGIRLWHQEGYRNLQWVLLDYVDVVVHIFRKESRDFYCLEKLWGDAGIEEIKE